MKKIWSVAQTEFSNSIRSKAFIIGLLAMPIMLIVMGGMQKLALDKKDTTPRTFAVVDRTGELYQLLETKAKKRIKTDDKTEAPFVAINYLSDEPDSDALILDMSQKVRNNEWSAFVIIEEETLSDSPGEDAFRYYTNSPNYRDLPNWIESTIHREIQSRRFDKAGLDPAKVKKLITKVPIQRLGLSQRSAGGQIKKGKKEDEIRTTVVPLVWMFLMYILLMTGAPTLLTSVMEEKMNKISEFLVSAISPFQLLMGKLIGVMMVSLLLSTLYIGTLMIVASGMNLLDVITPQKIALFYLFLILGSLMLGSVCVAIGAACNEIRDSQSFMFPVMMITMLPLMVWMPVLESPDATFARTLSLIPPFTPMIMMLRMSVQPGVPVWELILGIVLTTGFSILCVKAAGKIFRIGILSQGQTPSFTKIFKWLLAK